MILLTRLMLYQLSYGDSSAGWAESRQYKARATSLANLINLITRETQTQHMHGMGAWGFMGYYSCDVLADGPNGW